MASALNLAFMHVARRAEMSDPEFLAETFVDVGPLFAVLTSQPPPSSPRSGAA